MLSLVNDKRFSKIWFLNYAMIIAGALLMAAGYVFFLVPHKIVPGGVFGLSIIFHHMFDLPTGATALVLNIPLLIWGVKALGPRFGVKTIVGLVTTSLAIDTATFFWDKGALSDDVIISAIFGGALIGAGLGFIFKAKATTGGVDIVAKIIQKRTGAPMGRNMIIIDGFVVLAGIIAFRDVNLALYALVTIFTTGRVVDAVLEGMRVQKAALVVSEHVEEIADTILKDMNRGGTIFRAQGLFHGADRPVILTAVSRRQLVILEENIRRIDPQAFVIVFDAREILGEGFEPLAEQPA
jgi:uncharacterized membrane-anchored protein YitT (DUF2179 family)